ncbi:hypothetical protein [Schleiferilactobacillus harbinensis]|uniref:Uncharacterized protein n=1 Tax=Schleiferilactobacillus harbinensis TaxID=304207 RepID=A0A5P8M3P8_9LACO|nr:hypothetical protein [Schleiferilactobacillus harbinensis]QFR23099.1 hypothetical protein D1010_06585 [Schleiferilactobacillus harbinensis]
MLPLREDGPYPYRLLVKTGTGYIGYRVGAAIYARARLFAKYDPVLTIVRIDDAYDFTNDQDKLPTVLKETGGHAVLIQYTETLLKPEADPTDKTSDWQDF